MKLIDKLFTKGMVEVIKDGDKEEKLFIASDDVEDRQGERISQEGWRLENFRANPVIQWAHNPNEPAIATAEKVGFKEIDGKKKLVYSPKFHRKTPMSNYIADLVEEGVIKASSVGFKPLDWDDETCTYTKSELLEISFVNVPANQNALSLGMAKGYGMDVIKQVMPDIEIKEDKGLVEEELTEEKKEELKYAKMDKFWNIVYAFCDVYFKEETEPEQFESLLGETVELLKSLSDGVTETIDEKISQVDRKDLAKFLFESKEIMKAKEKEEIKEEIKEEVKEEIEETEEPKVEEIKEDAKEENNLEEKLLEIEDLVKGLSEGIKTIDKEISEKIKSIEESTKEFEKSIEDKITYLTSQSTEEKGVTGREPKQAEEKARRLALKAMNIALETLNKTK
jgi:HK97 family phage prohead protease